MSERYKGAVSVRSHAYQEWNSSHLIHFLFAYGWSVVSQSTRWLSVNVLFILLLYFISHHHQRRFLAIIMIEWDSCVILELETCFNASHSSRYVIPARQESSAKPVSRFHTKNLGERISWNLKFIRKRKKFLTNDTWTSLFLPMSDECVQ